jgi:hypothetical protein
MHKEIVILSVKKYGELVDRHPKTILEWIRDHKIHATRRAKGHQWEIEVEQTEYDRLTHIKEHRITSRKV